MYVASAICAGSEVRLRVEGCYVTWKARLTAEILKPYIKPNLCCQELT